MPYRKPAKKKRVYKRKRRRRGLSTKPDYTAIIRYQDENLENSDLSDVKQAFTYTLSDGQNFGQYTDIWDSYRINWVSIEFIPSTSAMVRQTNIGTASVPVSGTNEIPMCALAVDRDDSSTTYTYDSLKNRQGSVTFPATKRHFFKFRPNRLQMIYGGLTTTHYTIDTNTKQYLDCGTPTTPHYGLKFAMEQATPNENFHYTIIQKMSVSFKTRRN